MKKIVTIILAMSAILSLTACGENTSEQQSSPTSQLTSQPTSQTTSGTGNLDPESSATSAPESSATSAPESSVTSKPESSVTSKPESTAKASALPLKEYPAGSYFTNDGKPCTDHDDCNWDKPCNCVNFDNSIQSVGFAKYAYFKVTGRHVYEADKTEINADINEQTARANLKGLPCGTYIAVTTKGDVFHAMAVISSDDNGITVYQANYGGKCVVSTMTFSWKQFAAFFPHLEYYVK